MNILEIYDHYRIMPNLQQHQLRVAAVAQFLCERFDGPLDQQGIIEACLLHDMGNIIKSDLLAFPEALQPQGLGYWQLVKDDYIGHYGLDESKATQDICTEVGVGSEAKGYIARMGLYKTEEVLANYAWEEKICSYSDMRVGPFGIVSIAARIEDGRRRYTKREDRSKVTSERYDELSKLLLAFEGRLFSHFTIQPEDIADEVIDLFIPLLKQTEIRTN